MTDVFLISEIKLRMFSDLNDNVDTAYLKNAVRESQDIELGRILGSKLYEKLLSDVSAGTLAGEYKTLVDDYVQDALLYWAYYYALDALYLKPRNNGILRSTGGENSDVVDRELYNVKRGNVKNKAEWYSNKLSEYILDKGSGVFPELGESTKLYESTADYSTQYKSPIVFRNSAGIRDAEKAGIPITRGKAYSYLPPLDTNKIK